MQLSPRGSFSWLATLALVAGLFVTSSAPQAARCRSAGGEGSWTAPERMVLKRNPRARDATSLARGAQLYARECASCHGARGHGDGKSARDLERPATDLAAKSVVEETDGALFWKLTLGRKPMPGFRDLLSDDERWDVVNFLRELTGSPAPVVPEFTLPEPGRAQLSGLYASYVAVEAGLFAADSAAVGTASAELLQRIGSFGDTAPEGAPSPARRPWGEAVEALRRTATGLSAAQGLEAQRQAFAELSEAMVQALGEFGHTEPAPLRVFRCEDAAKRTRCWIQREPTPASPYGVGTGVHAESLLCPRLPAPERA